MNIMRVKWKSFFVTYTINMFSIILGQIHKSQSVLNVDFEIIY